MDTTTLGTFDTVGNTTAKTIEKITILGIDIKVIVIILFVAVIVLLLLLLSTNSKLNMMNNKYHDLMSGKKGADLEKIIKIRFREMDKVKANAKRITREHKDMKRAASKSISRMGLVKYDAFNDVTGKLSFCLALLDENGTGVVINSMHSRDNCYNFAKEIIKGESFIPLSEEEQQAITQAKTIDDELEKIKDNAEVEDYLNYNDEESKNYVEENAVYYEDMLQTEELTSTMNPNYNNEETPNIDDPIRENPVMESLTSDKKSKSKKRSGKKQQYVHNLQQDEAFAANDYNASDLFENETPAMPVQEEIDEANIPLMETENSYENSYETYEEYDRYVDENGTYYENGIAKGYVDMNGTYYENGVARGYIDENGMLYINE